MLRGKNCCVDRGYQGTVWLGTLIPLGNPRGVEDWTVRMGQGDIGMNWYDKKGHFTSGKGLPSLKSLKSKACVCCFTFPSDMRHQPSCCNNHTTSLISNRFHELLCNAACGPQSCYDIYFTGNRIPSYLSVKMASRYLTENYGVVCMYFIRNWMSVYVFYSL